MGWPVEQYAGITNETPFCGRKVKAYQQRDRTIGELISRTAGLFPEYPALKEGGKSFSYRELHDEVNRVAASLYYRWGVQKGDRIGIITDNCPEYCIVLLAAVKNTVTAFRP
ncbi:MAG: AMP-binding protein, partial [Firmicutes bacterium]|nr:AMP-binding protein [Bacillota bacterium]